MNREIKFRIWLKEKKQMIQDVHICTEVIGNIYENEVD